MGFDENRTKQRLAFQKDGAFKIIMMSDAHLSMNTDLRTLNAMERILDAEKPNLVLLGGDNVTDTQEEENMAMLVQMLAQPMEARCIPWAHVYGNHDEQTGQPKVIQQKYYEKMPYCVSQSGPEDIPGVGNYMLPIHSSQSDEVRFAVWGLDSHQSFIECKDLPYAGNLTYDILLPARIGGPLAEDFIRFEQLMWYWHTSKMLEAQHGHKVPGLMYFHIPIYEFNAIVKNAARTGFNGEYNEQLCTSEVNSGLFATLLQRGDVKGVYCGHDHINTFEGVYCGIHLGYDGNIGYRPYGTRRDDPDPDRHRLRGARVFELCEENPEAFQTRMVFARDL